MKRLKQIIFAIFIVLMVQILGCAPVSGTEYHVAKNGNDQAVGTRQKPFLTINRAAEVAMPGDTITVHEGIYREHVRPQRGGTDDSNRIVYRAAKGEHVEIRGSEVAKDWEPVGNGLWSVTLPKSYFGDYNPYAVNVDGPYIVYGQWNHCGEVYLNDESLYERQTEDEAIEKPMSWFSKVDDEQTTILANFGDNDPGKELVEINVRESLFSPDELGINYITIEGFHFRHAAPNWAPPNNANPDWLIAIQHRQAGAIAPRLGRGWIIRNNVITDIKCVGIICGVETLGEENADLYYKIDEFGSHEILNNHISRCGQGGVAGKIGICKSVVKGNLIEQINHKRLFGGHETAAIKFHGSVDVVIENNLIRGVSVGGAGGGFGIWIDFANQNTRITRNIIYDTAEDALIFEMNHGPMLVDNNIFFGSVWYVGTDAVVTAHNLFINKFHKVQKDFVTPGRKAGYYRPHTREEITKKEPIPNDGFWFNNIFVNSGIYEPQFDSFKGLQADHNLFLEGGGKLTKADANSWAKPNFKTEHTIKETAKGVTIEFNLPEEISSMKAEQVDAERIGFFEIPAQTITDGNGETITVNRDINNENRQVPIVGPLANPSVNNKVVWRFNNNFFRKDN